MQTTYILGKDAPLETTIARLSQQLVQLGFQVEEKSWLNPVEGIWSVHLQDADCPQLFTNGKGATQQQALASALGEFFERLSTNYFWADFYLGEELANSDFVHYPQEKWFQPSEANQLLDKYSLEIYQTASDNEFDPATLYDINSANLARGICALPFTRLSDNQQVYFPVNLLANLYASNGMAAGNNFYEAATQALAEIFERQIKQRILVEGISLPCIPEEVLAEFPLVASARQSLAEAGFTLQFKDASLGGDYPVICITLLNTATGGCFASFGAHPLFAVALERTLTELLQGRALNQLDEFPVPSFDLAEVASPFNLETHFTDSSGVVGWSLLSNKADFDFQHWNFDGTSQEQYEQLLSQLHNLGHQVYLMRYQHLGVDVCRFLVPDFSEIYPLEEVYYYNNNRALHLQKQLLNLAGLAKSELLNLAEEISQLDLNPQELLAPYVGLIPANNPFWQEFRLTEFNALIELTKGDQEEALWLIEEVLMFGHLSPARNQHYRCLKTLLEIELSELDINDYLPSLTAYYSPETLQLAQEQIQGKNTFAHTSSKKDRLAAQEKLIAAYEKVRKQLK